MNRNKQIKEDQKATILSNRKRDRKKVKGEGSSTKHEKRVLNNKQESQEGTGEEKKRQQYYIHVGKSPEIGKKGAAILSNSTSKNICQTTLFRKIPCLGRLGGGGGVMPLNGSGA